MKTIRKEENVPDVYGLQDNGRRGNPIPGCDCAQCFGYCLVDREVQLRTMREVKDSIRRQELLDETPESMLG